MLMKIKQTKDLLARTGLLPTQTDRYEVKTF